MKKRFNNFGVSLFFVFAFIFCFHLAATGVYAVTKTSGKLQVTLDEPIFSPALIWYPGKTHTKSFTVKNLDTTSHTLSLTATDKIDSSNNIASKYVLSIFDSATEIWGSSGAKSMQNFWDAGQVDLISISPGGSKDISMAVTMPKELGNEYQNKLARFDLIIGFAGTTSQVTTTSESSTSTSTNNSDTSCKDSAPGSAPTLLSAAATSVNSVTLTWSKAADPVSYYLVAYGTTPGNYKYGNPSVGGADTTSYTVSNLSGGVTYYFVIRAGNGCTPGSFSNELSVIPNGGLVTGIATEFAPNVLGESTQISITPTKTETPMPTPSGDVMGETTGNCSNHKFWYLVPLGYLLIFIAIAFLSKRVKLIYQILSLLLLTLIAIALLIYVLCDPKLFIIFTFILGLITSLVIYIKKE